MDPQPPMKPSELRQAFAAAKARAARTPAPPRLLAFVNADDHTARVSSAVPLHKPLFEPTPAEIWIDDYTPFHTHKTKLSFRNCDAVARRFKIEPPSSPLFKVMSLATAGAAKDRIDGKIAAGMEVAFTLEFSPQDVTDVAFDLVCCTERERFALPVRVRGRVAALDIPDDIHFGICPVKMTTGKALTVHNVGTRTSKFAFRTSDHFVVVPEHAVLAQGAAVQLELRITPPRLAANHGEMSILDDTGQTAVVSLVADVRNLDVYLSAPLVEPGATYISLSSRKTIKICNDSEHPLEFSWKAFPDALYEQHERDRLLDELDALEAAEREQLTLDEEMGGDETLASAPFDIRKAIETKYNHLRKAVVEDPMQFVDECFSVSPLGGRVWAHSEVDVVTCFSPAMALLYSCNAFLEVGGQEARLPLQIRGQGIGPNAKVVYNELLDFGEVFISDERTRDFTIQNKGEIPAVFELIPLTPALPEGMVLHVSPSAGSLAVNEMGKIEVSFSSRLLGEVFQPIRFRLQGSEEQLSVRFKATVVPPVFRFDVDQVDFGAVSYSFLQTRTVKLINTSKIAMDYTLRIPDEANYKKTEFELSPISGCLDAYGEQEIRVSFVPMNVKAYDYCLTVQVAGIATDLVRLPIRAQCLVSEVTLRRNELDFGASYLRYPHTQTLVLENKSPHLHARFEITEQDEHSRAIATYTANESCGTLAPEEKLAVDIHLSCEKLGPIRLPMSVTIPGSTDLPLAVTLTATGTGPRVELDQLDVNWGSCTCLVDHERVLTMTNTSLIPAPYKTFIRNARSKFQVDQKEGTVLPGEAVAFKLSANLDDTIVFKDTLHILIADGENLAVPLTIKGTGTTMWSPSELRVVDFGHQMTHRECEWSCTLENKGKRTQILTWSNRTMIRLRQQVAEATAVANKKATTAVTRQSASKVSGKGRSGETGASDEIVAVFSVFPATIELKPRTACVFLFKGLSLTAGIIAEELVCETRVGKEKTNKVAFATEIRGDFQSPTLAPSQASLEFVYVHEPTADSIPRQSQPLSLRNACALPLSFTLRTQPPFSLDCWEADLPPGESIDFTVEFYPGFKDDHQSRVLQGKVSIAYTNHPQRDSVDLISDISFPNLEFETTKIEFGCTLNDTQKSMLVNVTNVSKVDTTFRWVFIEDEQDARSHATTKKPYIPVNQVFDILPIRGSLKPGESERIEFLFYGHANRKFKSMVACEVEGGPEYELTLSGEASSLVYRLDKQSLDFGQVIYNKMEDREFAIVNVGKVPFSYAITIEAVMRGRVVVVAPMSGKIAPNEKQRVLVQLKPGIPELFEETMLIEIAHFQPIEFKLFGSGIFAAVLINLPRENHPASTIEGEHPKWRELKKQARLQLESSVLSAAAIAKGNGSSGGEAMGGGESKTSLSTGSVARSLDRGSSFASNVLGGSGPKSSVAGSPSKSGGTSTSHATLRSNAATTNGATTIDDLDIEIEASRMFFSEHLIVQDRRKQQQHQQTPLASKTELNDDGELREAEDNTSHPSNNALPPATKQKPRTGAASTSTGASAAGGLKPSTTRSHDSFPFVLSQFVLDFGNVVLGTHRVKKFSVVNIGHTPASFQLDKNLAQSRGFQIEPERVVRLPEKQPLEFAVTFQAHKTIALGVHQVQLPIVMKNGPPCLVTIRAVVTVPDISISMDTLDFGKIAVGTCHTIYTQLQNVTSVPVEWAIKKPMGSARDETNFRITPTTGLLAPGNRVNVQIEFVPDDGRLYALKLPVKVASNAKTRSLTLRGEGSELRVSFAPAMVELGPVLPCAAPTERLVELRNDSDYAVEVFSLDFDDAYKEDEEVMRSAAGFTTDEVLQLPLRAPGHALTDYLRQHGVLPPSPLTEPVDGSLEQQECDGTVAGADNGVEGILDGESIRLRQSMDAEPAQSDMKVRSGLDFIVIGPPRCGKSTQAKLLRERENLVVWTIDEAVRAIAEDFKSELGRLTRAALGLDDPYPIEIDPESSDPSNQDSTAIEPNEDNDSNATVDTQVTRPTMETLLEGILRWRLSQADMERGGVLDGWENAFVPLEATLRACAKVMPTSRVVWLQLDEDAYDEMTTTIAKAEALVHQQRDSQLATSSSQDPLTPEIIESVIDETTTYDDASDGLNEPAPESNEAVDPAAVASSEGETEDETLPVDGALLMVQKRLSEWIDASAIRSHSFAQYLHELPTLRRLLILFLARDRKSMDGMRGDEALSSDAPPHQHESIQVSGAPSSTTQSALLKAVARSDNFVLEFTIADTAPPLTIHSAITSALDKQMRELELSHLALPPPAQLQLVRRPPQRFSRKAVEHFSLHDTLAEETSESENKQVEGAGEPSDESGVSTRTRSTRWVLPPHAATQLLVRFASTDVGVYDSMLGFEIVGSRREFNLFCRGTTSVPHINTDPRNVFMSRVKSRADNAFVQKKFVLSKNQFEFGPLIVPTTPVKAPASDDAFAQLLKAGTNSLNIESFRISNISKFPLRVDFLLAEICDPAVYSFAPPFVELGENETKEVRVWASPAHDGLHENALVCCVSDNPEPVLFAMSCFGCTPSLELRGPWEQPAGDTSTSELNQSTAVEAPSTGEASAVSTPASTPRVPASAASIRPSTAVSVSSAQATPRGPILDFEQLLLKRQDEKTFYLENTCAVAVSWRLVTTVPTDFRVFPVEGTIRAFQKTPVLVVFTATVEAVYKHTLQIEFSDADSSLRIPERNHIVTLTLQAEAYKIDVCSFEADGPPGASAAHDGSLDFGLVRVGESPTRAFTIKNRGKYNIKFVLALRSNAARELFHIDPTEMVLEPDKAASVKVTFQSTRHELTLRDNKDIKCTIIEMLSGESCAEFYVLTSVRAVFSVFRLQPNRGLNFGPLKFNDKAKTKRLEIRNDGDFTFKFRVTSAATQHLDDTAARLTPLLMNTPLTPGVLAVGPFEVSPNCGSIDPGTTATLDVIFQPCDCSVYRQWLCVDISGRNLQAVDRASDPALRYELVGESCYPGIDASDFESIFEEQIVVRSIAGAFDEAARPGGKAAVPATPNASTTTSLLAMQTVLYAEKENVFSFGAMVAAANTKGSIERFKISNPTKVPTTVQFQISAGSGSGSGSGGASDAASQTAASAFSVQPSMWEIPPLEHRFVNIHFKPTAILSYSATFRATVDDSPTQVSVDTRLQFELRGEGTMPCVTILEPTHRTPISGALLMAFGRVRVSKTKELALVLRNDGILSATVLFSMTANPNFVFGHGNGSVVVAPRMTESMVIQFKPQKAHDEPIATVLKITVQNNAFEETTLKLAGQGYREDLVFEDLPHGHDDELHFGDIDLTSGNAGPAIPSDVKVFTLSNQSSNVVRFAWPTAAPFSFSPSVGQLRPHGYKLIQATFTPTHQDKAVVLQNHKLQLQSQRITLKADTDGTSEWDDTMHAVSFNQSPSTTQAEASTGRVAEPAYESLGTATAISLSCFAAADALAFECDVRSIAFRRTFMLQVCSHKITVTNTSKIRLAYAWQWIRMVPSVQGLEDFARVNCDGGLADEEDEDDECPFEINPVRGVIAAESAQSFVVRFAPMEVDDFQYELRFHTIDHEGMPTQTSIESTDTVGPKPLRIPVRGGSLRPACHFDVERSDYATRRALHLPGPTGDLGPLDPSIRIIEMESLGVRVKNTKRFYVVNPTNVSYEFTWTIDGDANASFRCATPKGLMLAGKRCEMIFEFTPQQLDLQEAFWRFCVPHFQVNQLFLFVGTTTEPRVTLDRGSVNFNTLLIGTKTAQSVALVNHEHIPFNFVFDKTTIDFAGEAPALLVHPLSGVVPPNGRVAIDLEFVPTEEKSYNFNLNCIVKRKPTRLSLNVKGEGYSIHDALAITGDDGSIGETRQVSVGHGNYIDFGAVRVHESTARSVVIHNTGKFNFDFSWGHAHTSSKTAATIAMLLPALTIEPLQGTVKKNDKVVCSLVFAPVKSMSLDTLGPLTCTVAGARHYTFSLHGSAVPPSLQFSFTAHDFGACFIAEADALPQSEQIVLTIFNMDADSSVDIDCVYEKKPHLRVECPPTVIGPRETVNIPIVFTARQEITYMEVVPFVINGVSTIAVSIRGEGVASKVEVANASMQIVTFGSLQVGQQLTRTAKMINRAKRRATVELVDEDNALQALGISMIPPHEMSLKAKETIDVAFRFAPTQRLAPFQSDVYIRVAGCRKKLLTLTGSCQGMDVQLETDTVSFGTVCLGSQLVRKLYLQNRGDVAAKFQWNPRAFAPDFSIVPVDGVIPPNHHKALEVTFKPTAVNADVRYERLACVVEGTDPVFVTLVGACVHQATSSIQVVHFESPVRAQTTKTVTIENKTSLPWNLLPVVQGDHWQCPENVAVPADGKATLTISYHPLSMTRQPTDATVLGSTNPSMLPRPELHQGSIFLAIPDGSALLYNLFGKASAPVRAGSLAFSTPAKKSLSISIPITNWLKQSQMFSVDIQTSPSSSASAQGTPSLTLQPSATRTYHLKVFSYTEGVVPLVVRFVNASNGEYLEYDVEITVTRAAEVETLKFDAPVRQSVKKLITIENPFPRDRTIQFVDKDRWWTCSSPLVRVRQLNDLNGRPEGLYEVEYRPLVHTGTLTSEATLTISFVELGEYTYKIVMTTQAAGVERLLQFKAPLGGAQTQTFSFTTFGDKGAELSCSLQQPAHFSVPASVRVEPSMEWEGQSHSIQIKFEPEALGDVTDTLVLVSDIVGEYRCSLQGTAVPPLPQGPFVFSTSREIDFKNVFSTPRDFEFVVDNPKFVVNAKTATVPAKSTKVVTVKVDPTAASGSGTKPTAITGKLLVSCPSMKDLPPWVFYLEASLA